MPMTRVPLHVCHRKNPNAIGFRDKNDSIGEIAADMPPGGRVESAKTFRVGADFEKQPLHLTVKTNPKFWRDFGIVPDRSREFFVRFRVKQMVHKPAILRARASDCSSGIPLT